MSDTSRDLTETTLSSTQVMDGHLLKVYRDEVEVATGAQSVREWIAHPGASAVVPLFEDGTTVLVRQFRYPPRRTYLEVPAGKIDVPGEDPADVALRELEEETGWLAEQVTRVGDSYPCIGYSNERIFFYVAEGLTKGTQDLSEGEVVDVVRMPLQEAVRQARTGHLKDMKTAMALVYAATHLGL